MDSNLSRLYYMLGNYDRTRSIHIEPPITDREADNLIGDFPRSRLDTGSSEPVSGGFASSSLFGEFDANSTATLEVSSNTVIGNTHKSEVPDGSLRTHLSEKRNVNGSAPTTDLHIDYHFNPLYTISDGGGEPQPPQPSLPNAPLTSNLGVEFASSPPDPHHFCFLAFILAGIGFLLPYNSFVIAADYFEQRFPNTPIVFDLSTTYIMVAFTVVIINNLVVESIPLMRRLKIGYLLCLSVMIFVVFYEVWAKIGGYREILVVMSLVAMGSTIQQSTFYGYASMLPKKYTQAVMIGESLAGIVVSANRIVTKKLYPHDMYFNTFLFFTFSTLVIFTCALVHLYVMPRTNFTRYYFALFSQQQRNNDGARMMHQINENLGLVNMYHRKQAESGSSEQQRNGIRLGNEAPRDECIQSLRPSIFSNGSTSCLDAISNNPAGNTSKVQSMLRTDSTEFVLPFGIDDEEIAAQQLHQNRSVPPDSPNLLSDISLDNNANTDFSEEFKTRRTNTVLVQVLHRFELVTHSLYFLRRFFGRIRQCNPRFFHVNSSLRKKYEIRRHIFYRIWPQLFSIMLVYFVTLSIFPGIESEIYSCHFMLWMPIILMTTFNLTDFIGKLISPAFLEITSMQILTASIARFCLIPLIAFCVAPRIKPFFQAEFWPILFSALLGLTNGLTGSLCMILAPIRVNGQMREITGNLMTFSFYVGLMLGSGASYVINGWVAGSYNEIHEYMIQNCLGERLTNATLTPFHYF